VSEKAAQIPVRNVCSIGAVTLVTTCLPLLLPEWLKPNVGFVIATWAPTLALLYVISQESRRLCRLAEADPESPWLKATKNFYYWTTFAWLPLPVVGLGHVIAMITGAYDPLRDDATTYGGMMAMWASSLGGVLFACCACLALVLRFLRRPERFDGLLPRSFIFYWALQFPVMLFSGLVAAYVYLIEG